MRRFEFIIVICILLLLALAVTGTAFAAEEGGVTVTVKIPRIIYVSSGAVHSNSSVVSLNTGTRVTFIAP